jgi:hypothetical protein
MHERAFDELNGEESRSATRKEGRTVRSTDVRNEAVCSGREKRAVKLQP